MTDYKQKLAAKFDGMAFRLGVLVTLTAVIMVLILLTNEAIGQWGFSDAAVEAFKVTFDLMAVIVIYLLYTELWDVILYALISMTGKSKYYALLGLLPAGVYVFLFVDSHPAATGAALAFGFLLWLTTTLHGTLETTDIEALRVVLRFRGETA